MNHEFEGLRLSVSVSVRVFQDGEELLRLGDYAVTIRTLASKVNLGIRQRDVDVMPWPGFGMIVPVFVGPACHGINRAAIQQIAGFGRRTWCDIAFGN